MGKRILLKISRIGYTDFILTFLGQRYLSYKLVLINET